MDTVLKKSFIFNLEKIENELKQIVFPAWIGNKSFFTNYFSLNFKLYFKASFSHQEMTERWKLKRCKKR